MSSPSLSTIQQETGSEFDAVAESLIRVAKINISSLALERFERGEQERRMESEDRATRGTEAGGPQTKCSGGVSEANVRASISALAAEEEDRATLSDASSRINVTDNSALGLPRAVIRMSCSKGTYVRAFARDLGEALGSGAHLDSLQRSHSGQFRVEEALSIEQAVAALQ